MSDRTRQKIDTYMSIAEKIGSLSTSSRLQVGSLALRIDLTKIAAFGYNGSIPNAPVNECTGTEEEGLDAGTDGFIHAEENLLIKFRESDPENYIILLTHSPCRNCTKRLVTAEFRYIYWLEYYRETEHLKDILGASGVLYGDAMTLWIDYPDILQAYRSKR